MDLDKVVTSALRGVWWRHVPSGLDPGLRPVDTASNRWQRGTVVEGVYLADSPQTVWAEFYRYLAETAQPPAAAMPRDLWSWRIELDRVADLRAESSLADLGLAWPRPDRREWPAFQAVGEALWHAGWPALVAPSAARPAGCTLCVFRETELPTLVEPVPPPERIASPPVPPRGMTT